jgi:hypothetical protein
MALRTLLTLLLFACSVPALAQESAPPQTGTTKTPVIKERQMNQRARIRQGVKSGALTKGEARQLREEQRTIQAEKQMAKTDGKVTPAERAKIRRDQNKASKDIYRLKHNNRTQGDQPIK